MFLYTLLYTHSLYSVYSLDTQDINVKNVIGEVPHWEVGVNTWHQMGDRGWGRGTYQGFMNYQIPTPSWCVPMVLYKGIFPKGFIYIILPFYGTPFI